jgi:EmrB/QacA subfamily drug resistance transporter
MQRSHWLVLFPIGLSTFMSALDGSVVNTILPVIQRELNSEIALIQWVVTAYLLVVSGSLLTFGRLGDMFGHKRFFLIGLTLFTLSSALCGFSNDAVQLILFRALQALGTGMLASNSPAILTGSVPSVRRGQALGIQSTMTYLGLTVGPSFGGWLAQALGWRSVFFINIPVGIITLIISLRFIPSGQKAPTRETFDIAGALLFIGGLTTLLLSLNRLHDWGAASVEFIGMLAASLVLLALFILIEYRSKHPMLDLHLFSSRIFSAASASAILNYICVFSVIFLIPYFLINGRGLNTAEAGLFLTIQPLVMAIVVPLSGTLSDRIGSRVLTTLGMLILAGGMFTLSGLNATSPAALLVIGMMLSGLGIGLFVSPNNSALMGAAPHNRQGIAAGVLATSRSTGQVLGVAIAGAVLASYQTAGSASAIFSAIHVGFILAGGFALIGAAASSIRGKVVE